MMRLVGNKRVLSAIDNLIETSHLPHAIIIEGDEGTGKHTLARYIALSALCRSDKKPCGKCKDCTLFLSNNHPDAEYCAPEDKKKSISIEQIRKIRNNAYLKPHLGGKKIFIFEKADHMSEISQNALLKIIEEPPQNILFVLLCESSSRLLSTIISRCALWSLTTPEEHEAFEYIKTKIKKQDDEIRNALRLTHNNIGKSLKMLSKKASDKSLIATNFLNCVLANSNAYELLKIVKPLEKDRVLAAEFLSELKLNIMDNIRKNPNNFDLKKLINLYNTINQREDLLITNINLPLFFTALVSAVV